MISRALALGGLLVSAGCSREPVEVVIDSPCDTFVSEFGLRRTPLLSRQDDGHFRLEISFTPAKNSEAEKIASAVKRGPTWLLISKTGRRAQALRLESGRLIVVVASEEEAVTLLEALCFKKSDLVFPEKPKRNKTTTANDRHVD